MREIVDGANDEVLGLRYTEEELEDARFSLGLFQRMKTQYAEGPDEAEAIHELIGDVEAELPADENEVMGTGVHMY